MSLGDRLAWGGDSAVSVVALAVGVPTVGEGVFGGDSSFRVK